MTMLLICYLTLNEAHASDAPPLWEVKFVVATDEASGLGPRSYTAYYSFVEGSGILLARQLRRRDVAHSRVAIYEGSKAMRRCSISNCNRTKERNPVLRAVKELLRHSLVVNFIRCLIAQEISTNPTP